MKAFLWAVLVGGLSVTACGGPGGGLGKPVALFPSQADLNDVASGTAVTPKGADGIADVDSWQMQAPAAAERQYPTDTTWDKLVVSTAQAHGNGVTLSAQLRCAAEETARFYTVNSGMPDDGLREHLLLRCGSSLAGHSFNYFTQQVPDGVPLAEIEAQDTASIQKMLDERFREAHGEFGLAAARGGGRYAVVAFSGMPRATLRDFSPVVTGDSVTLTGQLLAPAQYVVALATQGPYGVAHCDADPLQHLPAFKITCPLNAGDPATRIEIATKQEGRVLLEAAAQVEVRHDEQARLEYNAAAYGANKKVANSMEFRRQLFADLNQVRTAAGLHPFALESRQSVTDDRLAPYLYQTLHSGDAQQQTTITLGLLAGWDVNGLIKNGGIFCSAVNTARNPSRWLTQALDSPLGRWVLLEPDMSRIGIGASELTPAGEVAVVTTYSFFDSTNHQADEAVVLAELDRQRRAHGVSPVRRVASDSAMQRALRQINTNAISSSEALDSVIAETVAERSHDASGYLVETTDPKQLTFDPMFLTSSTLDLELGVTHYRAPGAAWGQYVVLFVVVDHGAATRMAKHSAKPRGEF
ncbi:MAG TPA: hypothetical protein VNW92_02690 [Polyangiaceae bacterium]|jgi:hypothetical protein|nr:hypothetical protein [Polyangiaceae bacterium]